MVAGSGWIEPADDRSVAVHFRYFLLPAHHAAAAAAEEVAGDVERTQDRRQGHHQRRSAGDDHSSNRQSHKSSLSSSSPLILVEDICELFAKAFLQYLKTKKLKKADVQDLEPEFAHE